MYNELKAKRIHMEDTVSESFYQRDLQSAIYEPREDKSNLFSPLFGKRFPLTRIGQVFETTKNGRIRTAGNTALKMRDSVAKQGPAFLAVHHDDFAPGKITNQEGEIISEHLRHGLFQIEQRHLSLWAHAHPALGVQLSRLLYRSERKMLARHENHRGSLRLFQKCGAGRHGRTCTAGIYPQNRDLQG